MHWIAIFILTSLAVAAQSVVAPHLELSGARPDFLVVLLVLVAFLAPMDRAILAGWFIGLCADPLSVGPPGLLTLSYGATTMGLVLIRESLFRPRVHTQFAAAFLMCVLIRTTWLAVDRWSFVRTAPGATRFVVDVMGSALYTAVLCPIFAQAILHSNRISQFLRRAMGAPGLRTLGGADV